MVYERIEILCSCGCIVYQKLWYDDRFGGRGLFFVVFEVWQDFGRGCMEFEEGEQDGMNLSSEFLGGRNDDGVNVVLFGGFVEVQKFLDKGNEESECFFVIGNSLRDILVLQIIDMFIDYFIFIMMFLLFMKCGIVVVWIGVIWVKFMVEMVLRIYVGRVGVKVF